MTVRRACGQLSESKPTVWRPVFSDISLLPQQGGFGAQDANFKDAEVNPQEGQARYRHARTKDAALRAQASSHRSGVRLASISLPTTSSLVRHKCTKGCVQHFNVASKQTHPCFTCPLNSLKKKQQTCNIYIGDFFRRVPFPVGLCCWGNMGNVFADSGCLVFIGSFGASKGYQAQISMPFFSSQRLLLLLISILNRGAN